jgi:hypothetical protein
VNCNRGIHLSSFFFLQDFFMNRLLLSQFQLLGLVFLLGSSQAASAAILATDDFNSGTYVLNGQLNGRGSSPSTGWFSPNPNWQGAGGPTNSYLTTSRGLVYPGYAGNDPDPNGTGPRGLTINAGVGTDGALGLRVFEYTTGTTWMGSSTASTLPTTYFSFLIDYDNLPSGNFNGAGLFRSSPNASLFLGNYGGAADQWALYNTAAVVAPVTPIPITTGVTNLAIVRVDWSDTGAETINVYINPDMSAAEPGVPSITSTIELGNNWYTFALNQYGSTQTSTLDGFMLTTAWADLQATAAVPEPGTYALIGSAAFGLSLFYRRRKSG